MSVPGRCSVHLGTAHSAGSNALRFPFPSALMQNTDARQGGNVFRRILPASILFVCLWFAPVGGHVIAGEPPLDGFSPQSSQSERQWEDASTDDLERPYIALQSSGGRSDEIEENHPQLS